MARDLGMLGLGQVLSLLQRSQDEPHNHDSLAEALEASCKYCGTLVEIFSKHLPSDLSDHDALNSFHLGMGREGFDSFLQAEAKMLRSSGLFDENETEHLIAQLKANLHSWCPNGGSILTASTGSLVGALNSLNLLRETICPMAGEFCRANAAVRAGLVGILSEARAPLRKSMENGALIVGDLVAVAGDPSGLSIFVKYWSVATGAKGLAQNLERLVEIKRQFASQRTLIRIQGMPPPNNPHQNN